MAEVEVKVPLPLLRTFETTLTNSSLPVEGELQQEF